MTAGVSPEGMLCSKRRMETWGNLGDVGSLRQSEHRVSPARFETFQLLYKEGFEHLRTLKERRVVRVVVATVVKDFGHVGHKLGELVVMSLLQAGFHCGEVCKVTEIIMRLTIRNLSGSLHRSLVSRQTHGTAIICSYPLAPWLHDNNQVRRGDPLVQEKAMPFCETVEGARLQKSLLKMCTNIIRTRKNWTWFARFLGVRFNLRLMMMVSIHIFWDAHVLWQKMFPDHYIVPLTTMVPLWNTRSKEFFLKHCFESTRTQHTVFFLLPVVFYPSVLV